MKRKSIKMGEIVNSDASCSFFKLHTVVFVISFIASGLISSCSPSREPANINSVDVGDADSSPSGIIGGTLVKANEPISKSIVAIVDTAGGNVCTGSLIAEGVVLSAAHCIGRDPKAMMIIFAVNAEEVLASADSLAGWLKNPKVRRVQSALVSSIWIAREKALQARFIANNRQPITLTEAETKNTGDISVLNFSGKTPAGYAPAKFLPDASLLKNGATVTLAGYGFTDGPKKSGTTELREVQVQIHDVSYSQTEITLDQNHGKGACHGDSGGPAYLNVNGQEYLWGITSRGVDDINDHCSTYSAYTNALAYSETIQKSVHMFTQSGN
ncbi:MAG: trypsin-like serine protease [Bdellovibrionaceae bacterium]|nr:trypsin-like serine protease [Pseudobdellovibrionaceae bacterium]